MSVIVSWTEGDNVSRSYDETNDRLFLVYYPITPGFNANKWGVTATSIDANIHTAINKPVVISRKNPNNKFHTHQAGNYVHPTLDEAIEELGHPLNAEEYFNWQEKYAIGRVRNVEKRGEKGYAFTLEITDPEAKNILKSDTYRKGIPGWTSPQILSNAHLYPEEEQSEIFDHWVISHIALVDVPAYGFQQAGVKAKCLGAEQECKIKTRSASQENLGFCIKEAIANLIKSHSSLSSHNANSSYNLMSTNENISANQPNASGGETVTYSKPLDTFVTNTNPNAETKQEVQEEQGKHDRAESPGQEEPQKLGIESEPKTLQEAQAMVRQMSELLRDTQKQLKSQGKELETIRTERKQARLSYIIPRDLFKSDESHLKEVQKAMSENVPENFLIEYWKTRRELAMAQSNKKMEEPLVAKSASLQNSHDVPDFSSSQSQNVKTNIQKTLELQRMILEGGAS